jgi:GT2 family glycosyltransferase
LKLPFVSVIVLNYNGGKFIKNCLDSLKKTNYDAKSHEIIVVDNASTDNSIEIIKSYGPWIKFVQTGKNLGYSGGNNAGVSVAKGKYVAFLNPDTTVDKNWLLELVNSIESDNTLGACSSKVLYSSDKTRINTIGGFWSVLGLSGSLGGGKNKDDFKESVYTFYPTGCSMIINKKLYTSLGKFDDDYFLYCEDPDIGWRLWDSGYKVALAPKSIVYHLVSASLRGLDKKSYGNLFYFYNTRNGLITIVKNATRFDLLWMVPLYMVSWLTLSLLFLVRGKFRAFKSIIKGLVWPTMHIVWLAKKRRMVTHKRTGKAKQMMTGFVESTKIFLSSKIGKHFS